MLKKKKKSKKKHLIIRLLSNLILSILIIPENEDETQSLLDVQKDKTMAGLLKTSTIPTKESLLKFIVNNEMEDEMEEGIKKIYDIIVDKELNPFEISEDLKEIFEYLEKSEELKKYLQPFKDVMTIKIIKSIHKSFSVMKLSELYKILHFINRFELERLILIQFGKRFGIMINHKNGKKKKLKKGTIEFGKQSLEIEDLSRSIIEFGKRLHNSIKIINSKTPHEEKKETNYSMDESNNMKKRQLFLEFKKKWEIEQQKVREKVQEEKQKLLGEQKKKLEDERTKRDQDKRAEIEKKLLEERKKEEEARRALEELETSKKKVGGKKKNDKKKTAQELLKEKQEEIENEKKEREKKLIESSKK
jgi:hypothetical protein